MTKRTKPSRRKEDPVLTRLTKLCLALPETRRQMQNSHAAFTVGKRTFAYFLNNHHNDGIIGVACKTLPGDNAILVRASPERFCMPAYIGPRGWVTLRLDRGPVDWNEVRELLLTSYQQAAPKRLAAAAAVLAQ